MEDDLDAAYREIFGDHPDDWLTWSQAAQLVGCPVSTIDWHTRSGRIEHRPRLGHRPSLRRSSVEEFAAWWARAQIEKSQRNRSGSERLEVAGYVSSASAAELLGLSQGHIVYLIRHDKVAAELIGHRWWLPRVEVERLAMKRERWISWSAASQLVGISTTVVAKAVTAGSIVKREIDRASPWLDRSSVLVWAAGYREVQRQRGEQFAVGRAAQQDARRLAPDADHVWLERRAAAAVLGVGAVRLGQLTSEGRVPALFHGRRWWYRRDHVEQLSAARAFQRRRRGAQP